MLRLFFMGGGLILIGRGLFQTGVCGFDRRAWCLIFSAVFDRSLLFYEWYWYFSVGSSHVTAGS